MDIWLSKALSHQNVKQLVLQMAQKPFIGWSLMCKIVKLQNETEQRMNGASLFKKHMDRYARLQCRHHELLDCKILIPKEHGN